MNRTHKPTSKEGENFIKPHKKTHFEKIKEGLEKLRVGGTHEEISEVCGLRPDQVWKRLSELERDQKIFNTGITRRLKSSVNGIVWQLVGMSATQEHPVIKKPDGRKKETIVANNPLFDNILNQQQ